MINFREPLGKSQHIRLLGCPLCTSWYNLIQMAEIIIFDHQENSLKVKTILAGNCPLESLGKNSRKYSKMKK